MSWYNVSQNYSIATEHALGVAAYSQVRVRLRLRLRLRRRVS